MLDLLTDKVHTSQLLQGLEKTSSEKTLAKSTLAALDVRCFAERHLVEMVGLNLIQFLKNRWVINRQATKLSEGLCGVIVSVFLDEPTWCIWQNVKSENSN